MRTLGVFMAACFIFVQLSDFFKTKNVVIFIKRTHNKHTQQAQTQQAYKHDQL